MKSKIFKLSIFTIFILIFLWHCNKKTEIIPWNIALNENTVYTLNKSLTKIKKHLENAQQFSKSGKSTKAREEMNLIKSDIEKLETIQIPLLNTKAHIHAAFQHILRKEINEAESEFNKARTLLSSTKMKVKGASVQNMNELLSKIENLEKNVKQLSGKDYKNFISIAEHIQQILNE